MRDLTLWYKTQLVVFRSKWEMRNPTLITSTKLIEWTFVQSIYIYIYIYRDYLILGPLHSLLSSLPYHVIDVGTGSPVLWPLGFLAFVVFQFSQSKFRWRKLCWSVYTLFTSRSYGRYLISHWMDDPSSSRGFNEIDNHNLIFSWYGQSLFISTFWYSEILWVTKLPLSLKLVNVGVDYFHTTLIWWLTRFQGFRNPGL